MVFPPLFKDWSPVPVFRRWYGSGVLRLECRQINLGLVDLMDWDLLGLIGRWIAILVDFLFFGYISPLSHRKNL